MKLAISITGQTLNSPFDARFGRAESFCLIDTDTGDWTAHPNPALSASGGAGVQAAQFVVKLGAQAVVSGAYGPKAYDTLSAANIRPLLAPDHDTCSASDILGSFKAGHLIQAGAASHGGHHGG
jgi:predicted Fe-Mo cluster-binding NifX family protein